MVVKYPNIEPPVPGLKQVILGSEPFFYVPFGPKAERPQFLFMPAQPRNRPGLGRLAQLGRLGCRPAGVGWLNIFWLDSSHGPKLDLWSQQTFK